MWTEKDGVQLGLFCMGAHEELKRTHPDFREKEDWVLWIVPDMMFLRAEWFGRINYHPVAGNIEICKKSGAKQNLSVSMRRPYNNFYYNQMCLKKGSKKTFGIPLVFKTFAELQAITDIYIQWTCGDAYIANIPILSSYGIHYSVQFESEPENSENRCFVLCSDATDFPEYPLSEGFSQDNYEGKLAVHRAHYDEIKYGYIDIDVYPAGDGAEVQFTDPDVLSEVSYDVKNDRMISIEKIFFLDLLCKKDHHDFTAENDVLTKMINKDVEDYLWLKEFGTKSSSIEWDAFCFSKNVILSAEPIRKCEVNRILSEALNEIYE